MVGSIDSASSQYVLRSTRFWLSATPTGAVVPRVKTVCDLGSMKPPKKGLQARNERLATPSLPEFATAPDPGIPYAVAGFAGANMPPAGRGIKTMGVRGC
ncbi:MAG TPA: hypothetical protein VGL90_07525, partial [Casimicrobiaceae bacterium]